MKELKWYYPKTLADAEILVQQKNVLPHGGGTGLLLRNLTGVDGLIELYQLPLKGIKRSGNIIKIGSLCTYADVVLEMRKIKPDHILEKCLRHSANTPLRNRITVGGSIAMFPPWSDLIGALIVLNARVSLIGENPGDFPIERYIKDKILRQNTMFTAVKFSLADWHSAHYREVRTSSDMPIFNHTVLLKITEGRIVESRLITVGTATKYTRLTKVEEYLNGLQINSIDGTEIEKRVSLKFTGSRIDDPAYTSIKAGIELGRMIQQMVRS